MPQIKYINVLNALPLTEKKFNHLLNFLPGGENGYHNLSRKFGTNCDKP